jgi:hypothetical protein
MFDLARDQVANRQLADIGDGALNFTTLTERLEAVRRSDGATTASSFEHRLGKQDGRKVRLTARRLDGTRSEDNLLFVTVENVQPK